MDTVGLVVLISVGVVFDIIYHVAQGVDDVDVRVDDASSSHDVVDNDVDSINVPPPLSRMGGGGVTLLRFLLLFRYERV